MSYSHLCPLFGRKVQTLECTYSRTDAIIVQEEFLADRWIIFYRRRSGDLEVIAHYYLLNNWMNNDYRSRYAPVVDAGVLIDKDKSHIVIEQDHTQRCIFVFENSNSVGAQVKELVMCPVFLRREEVDGAEAIQGRVAASALRRLSPVHGNIVDSKMIATVYSRKAFVLEKTESNYWLDVYTWTDALWSLRQSYYRVDSLDTRIPSLRAPIVNVFVQDVLIRGSVLVVEESDLLRWWHVYEWDGLVWRHRNSSNVLLCDNIILSTGEIGSGFVSGREKNQHVSVKTVGLDNKSSDCVAGFDEKEMEVIDLTREE
jgi:hypothetical protein